MKINPPKGLGSFKGIILLKYIGYNDDWLHRRCIRPAELTTNFPLAGNSPIKLHIDFKEFLNEGLYLDLNEEVVKRTADSNAIGTAEAAQISIDNTCFIISGIYYHPSITLAHYEQNTVEFDFIIDLETVRPTFPGILNKIIKSNEFNLVVCDYR